MPNVAGISSGDWDDASYAILNADTSTARDSTTAPVTTHLSTATVGHGKIFSSKGIYRYAVAFDLGGNDTTGANISGTVASANLVITTAANLTGFSKTTANTSNTVYLVKMSGYGSEISDQGTFNDMDGWVSSGSYDGNVTLYEDGNVTEAASSTLTFTLNSTAITDINSAISSGSTLPMMLVSEDDFLYVTATGGLGTPEGPSGFFTGEGIRVNTTEATSGTPYLSLTYAASSYGHDVSGVSNASIKKVNGIARSPVLISNPKIEKISGSE